MSLQEGEKESVIISLSDHFSVLAPTITFFSLSLVFLSALTYAAFALKDANELLGGVVLLTALSGILLSVHFFFLYLVAWRLSDLILTTSRIINLDVLPYLRNDSLIVDLHQINEIKKYRHGLMQNLFNYGTLVFLIFGGTKEIKLTNIKFPSKVASFIEAYKNGVFKECSIQELRARYNSNEKFM